MHSELVPLLKGSDTNGKCLICVPKAQNFIKNLTKKLFLIISKKYWRFFVKPQNFGKKVAKFKLN